MSTSSESQFYRGVKQQLQTVQLAVSNLQRLIYSYQLAWDKERETYRRLGQDSLAYLIDRTSYFLSRTPRPEQATNDRIRVALTTLLAAYERILWAYYPDELVPFARERGELLVTCDSLGNSFAGTYFDNPPPIPIDRFGVSVRNLKNSVRKRIEVIDRLLPIYEAERIERPKVAFIAKGFGENEEQVSKCFQGILDSLGIRYMTGEPYGPESVWEKIIQRIKGSDILVAIVQTRYGGDGGKAAGAPWIVREMEYARSHSRPLIIIAEEGTDLAGFEMEKDIIFFKKDNTESMQRAIKKFLEALRAHGLITKTGE